MFLAVTGIAKTSHTQSLVSAVVYQVCTIRIYFFANTFDLLLSDDVDLVHELLNLPVMVNYPVFS